MVRREVAERKLATAVSRLDQAEVIVSRPKEEFLADPAQRDLATFYIFLAIQECVDLAAHWCADAGWAPPDSAASSFDQLADHGLIDRDLATSMHGAVGLRNRIAHGYAMLEHERIQEEAGVGIEHLRRFLTIIADRVGL